jgi:hypothetical protein
LLPVEADRCARLLGLRVRDLLAGAASKAPMALLLVGQDDEDFLVLDPCYPAQGQPLRIAADILLEMFAGELIVCARGPSPGAAPIS